MSDTVAATAAARGRYEERAFGFWIYMMSDAIIFALLFATYIVMLPGTAGGPTGADVFNLPRVFGETMRISSTVRPRNLTYRVAPPMTLPLPGMMLAVVTPPARAMRMPGSPVWIASSARMPVWTGPLPSLPSS